MFRNPVEIVLGVERRHASAAGGGDRLPIDVVLHVAAGKHAGHARLCSVVREDVAVGVELDLTVKQ